MEKKKNSKHYIIPAAYFKEKGITPIAVKIPEKTKKTNTSLPTTNSISNEIEKKPQVNPVPKIILNQETKRTSGFSLKSIREKKEHQIKKKDIVLKEEDLPKRPFTEKDFIKFWNLYIEKLRKEGKHNLASILAIDIPKVEGTVAHLEFPNATNKVELERQQYELLSFIRKALNNYDISLNITVNEIMEKQYAYTAIEKFEKLKAKNPNIDMLRQIFDLDI